jgi:hypothetical protein
MDIIYRDHVLFQMDLINQIPTMFSLFTRRLAASLFHSSSGKNKGRALKHAAFLE